jgi:hypothetical protein
MMLPRLLIAESKSTMKNQTETLSVGSPAPSFTLSAANREGSFSLTELISRGPLIIEFQRGTW